MQVGGIYKWATNKARGHTSRTKYHVFIGRNQQNKCVFLFINSENTYGEGFELKKTDYSFFTKSSSYIGCTSTVKYSAHEIKLINKIESVGLLEQPDIPRLIQHLQDSEVMEQRDIDFICECLKHAIKL